MIFISVGLFFEVTKVVGSKCMYSSQGWACGLSLDCYMLYFSKLQKL